MTAIQTPVDTASAMEEIHGVDVSWLHHSTRGKARLRPCDPWVETARLCGATQREPSNWRVLRTLLTGCCYRPSPSPAGSNVARPEQRRAAQDFIAWRSPRQTPLIAAKSRAEAGGHQARIAPTTAPSSSNGSSSSTANQDRASNSANIYDTNPEDCAA